MCLCTLHAGILQYIHIKELVLEKETRLRESMKMMGLSGWILWLTWYLKQFLFLMIAVIIMTILMKVSQFIPLKKVCTQTILIITEDAYT